MRLFQFDPENDAKETRKVAMKGDKYLWLVTSKADPEKEEEYNKWYDEHVETFFQFPGV
jgi:antibiotic biosynthesis monooxygenase (ABM) superfamily enzyme